MAEINLHVMGERPPMFEWEVSTGDHMLDLEFETHEPDGTISTQLVSMAFPNHRGGRFRIKRARLR